MIDPVAVVARAAAQRLKADARPGLVAEVEAALAAWQSWSVPPHYGDPVALASMVVAIASLVPAAGVARPDREGHPEVIAVA